MSTAQPQRVLSQPGVKRDSTRFEGQNYSDALWCRWNARGLPRKMAGYQSVTSTLEEIVRGMDAYAIDTINYLHLGSQSLLTQVQTNFNGGYVNQDDRTPAGFVPNAANLWQFASFVNKVSSNAVRVVAHASHSLLDIANSDETAIYFGLMSATGALTATAMDPVSGGILAIPPYVMAFSNGGRVDVSAPNDLTVPTAGSAFVTAQKIVKALPLRNFGGPAALLWSLNAVVTATFDASIVTGVPFDFNEVSTSSSILSEQGVVEFDSIYYWVGVDRFMMFNGIVRELPNNMNIDFFFKNLNFTYRQKVFAFIVPRWGEVWWCFPSGNATECNHAVIFNVRLNTWYDTPLPDGGRSAAVFAKVFQRPFMADVDLTSLGYTLWQQETGTDKVLGTQTTAVRSYFETHEISPLIAPQPHDKAYRVSIVETDFEQSGDLTVTVRGRANARSQPADQAQVIMPEVPTSDPATQVTEVKTENRLLSFKFESNEPGGDYDMGQVMAHIEPTTGRYTQ